MKRLFTVAILLIATFSILNAKEITGRVHHNKKGMPNIVVSDGFNFTVTDKDGNFSLNPHKESSHIFIVTPSGYITSCDSGSPHFYRSVNEKDFNFELFKWGIPGGPYVLFAVGDPQPKGEPAFERVEQEAFRALKEQGNYYMTMKGHSKPVISLFLGDILWDNLEMYPRMKKMIKDIGHPVWPVIGNHDHDYRINDDKASAHIYEDFFGPANYAFNAGNDYFIVLDNILYEGNKTYKEGVNEKQIKWVKEYLKYIPEGSHIYLAMHAPIYYYRGKYKMVKSQELMDVFNGYKVTVLSGHTHVQCNSQPRENIREYNIASIGGAWWLWDCQYSKDGTPLGYQIFDYNGKQTLNHFQALGKERDFQMQIYAPGTVEGYPDKVVVKIWNWDPRWEIRIEQSVSQEGKTEYSNIKVEQIRLCDPNYSSYLQKEYIFNSSKVGKGSKPINDVYFFFTAKPSADADNVQIFATDPFGYTYTETLRLTH